MRKFILSGEGRRGGDGAFVMRKPQCEDLWESLLKKSSVNTEYNRTALCQ